MKRMVTRLLIISCLLAAGGINSVAQEKKPRPDEPGPQKPGPGDLKAPADGTFKVLASKFTSGRVVKGAPYSATATTEHIQTLSDGNQIIRRNQSKLYRDGEGRTRIEQTLETIGRWAADGEARQGIFINDPVAGVSWSLDPRTHTAHKNITAQKMSPAEAAQSKAFAAIEAAKEKKLRAQGEPLPKPGKEAPNEPALEKKFEMLQQGKMGAAQTKKESLGTQTIEGVTAEGTRSTLTIPAGEIGNTLPIEVVDENWYSPELQIMVMTRRRDPRSGETTYRLINISRSEPDRSLFEVPADHTVRENKIPLKPKPIKEEQ
ncbi:MAG TPA: hypothetical protein VFD58_23850 [Blastocatellia bacterium]|nr:hypothetical protein [Blastocatellia bacterium]